MPSKKKNKSSRKSGKGNTQIDDRKRDEIKEKNYIIKQLETSIKLLESVEDNVVLDALVFLSKYGDANTNNMNYLQFLGLLPVLIKSLDRNICIIRLSLRLINLILRQTDMGIYEIDQEKFDDDVLRICDFYLTTDDEYIKQFAVEILERLASTNRAPTLIFKVDLLKPIQATVASTENMRFLEYTLKLFCHLIDASHVVTALIEPIYFNPVSYLDQMKKYEPVISHVILCIFEKLSHVCVDAIQKRLKGAKIVEEMIDIVIDDTKVEYRLKALRVINYCMNSEETNSYFTCAKQFLQFSHWTRTCDDDYILISAEIFETISSNPAIRQVLYDLSVDETILYFLRSNNKKVLNKACEGICYMSTHKYSCDKMMAPVVMKRIFEILKRKDAEEDPENEVALKTVHELTMRNPKTIDMLYDYDGIPLMVEYFHKGLESLKLDTYLRGMEILNLYLNSCFGTEILNLGFYHTLLHHFEKYDKEVWISHIELMIICLVKSDFRSFLQTYKLPSLVLRRIRESSDDTCIKYFCSFIFNCLIYKKLAIAFIRARLLLTLKGLSPCMKIKVPLIDRVINSAYSVCLPLKFFENNKLELTDRIRNCFYIICGQWTAPFPFLELLEKQKMSTLETIYVVHYQIDDSLDSLGSLDFSSLDMSGQSASPDPSANDSSKKISFDSASLQETLKTTVSINYGKLSLDPYLFLYLRYLVRHINNNMEIEDKIKILALFVDQQLSGPKEEMSFSQKVHAHKNHIATLKKKLGTNLIPIGYMRIGFQCERALLFKSLSDKVFIPSTLERGIGGFYWNEVAVVIEENRPAGGKIKYFVVDLMKNVGNLMSKGSRDANIYCGIK